MIPGQRRIRGIRSPVAGGTIITRPGGSLSGVGPPQATKILDQRNQFANTGSSPGGGGGGSTPDIQTLLDGISSTHGTILYRNAADWVALAPGTSGQILETLGAAANPAWAAISVILDTISSTRGVVLYRGASGWAALSPGTAGQLLHTGGTGADPYWGDQTSYANVGGTGDRTAIITVTSNGAMNSGTDSNFVDGDFSANSTGSRDFNSGATGNIVLIDFGVSTYRVIDEIKWYQDGTQTHSTWVVEGSVDGDHFVELKSSFTLGGVAGAQVISFINTVGYRYYRLSQTHDSSGVSSSPWNEEMEYKIASVLTPASPINNVKSYSSKGGKGNRSSFLTVTTTAALGGGTIQTLVEGTGFYGGTDGGSFASFFTAGQSGKEIKFDFGASYSPVITEFTWFQDGVNSHGTWDFEGSTNGSSWTSLATGLTLGGATRTTYTGMSGNTTPYRYYRLIQTAGVTSSSPWNREIWFKLSA